jgi:hypothetical protein
MRSLRTLAALAAAAVSAARAHAAPGDFQLVRADENYAYLADRPRNAYENFKYIPLPGDVWLSLGGEARERLDSFSATRFGQGPSDSYVLQRLLVHADAHFGEHARVFVQLGQADAFGKSTPLSPSDVNRFDVQNAFVDFTWSPIRLRLGRQELLFNATQRFVSVREGPNLRQSFDGARLTWRAGGGLTVDAFASRPVNYAGGAFDDSADASQAFYGAYLAQKTSLGEADLYLLVLERDHVTFGARKGNERRQSYGARLAGKRAAWDYDVEGVFQTGAFAGETIRAWAVGATAGYTFRSAWSPRLGLEVDAGSGDSNPDDQRLGTFNPLFPKGAYFNESALTSWANSTIVRATIGLEPARNISLQASVSPRWKTASEDAVYLQPYTPLSGSAGAHGDGIGAAWKANAVWKASRFVTFTAEAVHQEAGGPGRAWAFCRFRYADRATPLLTCPLPRPLWFGVGAQKRCRGRGERAVPGRGRSSRSRGARVSAPGSRMS